MLIGICLFTSAFLLFLLFVSFQRLQFQKGLLRVAEQDIADKVNDLASLRKAIEYAEIVKQKSERQRHILDHIISAANSMMSSITVSDTMMLELADELRIFFSSEYCAIGKVDEDVLEDYVVAFEPFDDESLMANQNAWAREVRMIGLDNQNYKVCNALKSSDKLSYFDVSAIDVAKNKHYRIYAEHILKSKSITNTTVIPVRNANGVNYGYIQLINSSRKLSEVDIEPFGESLLQLMQILAESHRTRMELEHNRNILKDADFFQSLLREKDNVDQLFDTIMDYLAEEFNAAVITYRIPLLEGTIKSPLFYLRRCFISKKISDSDKLKAHYYRSRKIQKKEEMGGYSALKCVNNDIVIEAAPCDANYYSQYNLDLNENVLIVPIVRDYSANCCLNPNRESNTFCKKGENADCLYRFRKLYGIFKLRTFRNAKVSGVDDVVVTTYDQRKIKETKSRLLHLSKQITILLNSIVDKSEKASLYMFREQLRNTSFIKIRNFDQSCVDIIKASVKAKDCMLFRYDSQDKILKVTATTNIISSDLKKCECFIDLNDDNNILVRVFKSRQSAYTTERHSQLSKRANKLSEAIAAGEPVFYVPMIRRDKSCTCIIMLIGRQNVENTLSPVFWEPDREHIELIVDVLNRISESDTERLNFISRLSHELLHPINQLVNDNDEIITTAERNKADFKKDTLIEYLKANLDRNMLFKYIVYDVENIYKMTDGTITYNITRQDNPQRVLLDAVRLLEKDAHATKSLNIITSVSDMPPMFFDKERITQVFINLLKNAIRYSDRGTQVEIYYKASKDFHEIKFANYGIGIQENEVDSIFELFHRGENAKQKEPNGSGIGLFIVKEIMAAHGGDCVVRRLNYPTEISILLPTNCSN